MKGRLTKLHMINFRICLNRNMIILMRLKKIQMTLILSNYFITTFLKVHIHITLNINTCIDVHFQNQLKLKRYNH